MSTARNGLDAIQSRGSAAPPRYRRLTCRELACGEFDLAYLIPGVLADKQPAILAAPRKALKTTLLVDLAVSLAVGGRWLGYFKTARACHVAMMSGESGLTTLQETARRVAAKAGYHLADIGGLTWCDTLPRLDSATDLLALADFLRGDEVEVLVVDPAYMAMPGGDAGNLFVMGALLRGLAEVCQACGVTPLLAHHTRRTGIGEPYGPPELDHLAWASFPEFARQWLLLGRRERYEPGTGMHRLWLSVGGSAGHSGLWALDINEGPYAPDVPRLWKVSVLKPDDVRQDERERASAAQEQRQRERIDGIKRRLVNALAKFSAGETERVIRDRAGVGGTLAKLAFAELLDEGKVVPCEVVKICRKAPYPGYRLAGEQQT